MVNLHFHSNDHRLTSVLIGTVIADIAKSRAEIESARLLVLSAAVQIDKFRAKGALKEIGIAKVSLTPATIKSTALKDFSSSLYPQWPSKSSTARCRPMAPRVSPKTKLLHRRGRVSGHCDLPTYVVLCLTTPHILTYGLL